MRTIALLLVLGLAAVTAIPRDTQRIVGGTTTTISQYPQTACLLRSNIHTNFVHACGGVVLNNRSILTAAHCLANEVFWMWRARLGSSFASSGGRVYEAQSFIIHSGHNFAVRNNNDIAILRVQGSIVFIGVTPALLPGANYQVPDNAAVWAVGWGTTSFNGSPSETLRHVQVWVVNQATCTANYRTVGATVLDSMLCAGWINVGGRGQCHGDSGGPLIHNRVVVGISSWGEECAHARYPGVNTRLSNYVSFIQSNA